jgi:hypothetical protein
MLIFPIACGCHLNASAEKLRVFIGYYHSQGPAKHRTAGITMVLLYTGVAPAKVACYSKAISKVVIFIDKHRTCYSKR